MALTIGGGITIGAGVGVLPGFSPATGGLVLHLDAGNTSSYPGTGNVWTDLVASKPFTLYNSPTYNSSKGGYLNFVAASSQYALLPAASRVANLSNWTIEAWVSYTGTVGTNPAIVTQEFANSKINYVLGTPDVGGLVAPKISVGAFPGNWYAVTPGYTPTLNEWYQVVGTYDGSAFKLYINGVFQQELVVSVTTSTSDRGIYLMRRWDANDFWGGGLGVVRMYSTALNSTQITGNWESLRGRFGL